MYIIINRDSVCMGDDVYDHRKIYRLDDSSTYEDLFHILTNDNYLPHVYGNNVVWVLKSDRYDCIFSYFTKTGKMSPGLSEKSLYKLFNDKMDSVVSLVFDYYTTPLKWKEHILGMYKGDQYEVWHDGWIEEIKYCDYVMSLGTKEQ